MKKEKRLGSKLFSNCYKMNATMFIPYDELIKLKQVNYCDLDEEILNYRDVFFEANSDENNNNKDIVCEVDADSSIVLDFERKIFIMNARLEFKEIPLKDYTEKMLDCRKKIEIGRVDFPLCMQTFW
jgi:tetrahydromethanopterin S-methyltransferase subunit H